MNKLKGVLKSLKSVFKYANYPITIFLAVLIGIFIWDWILGLTLVLGMLGLAGIMRFHSRNMFL